MGAVEDARGADPVCAQGGEEGHGAPVAVRRISLQALASLCPAPERCHVGLDPGLVHEDQAVRVEVALERLPARPLAGDRRARLLSGEESFFEAQTLAPEEAPDRVPAHRDPRSGQLDPKPVNPQMRRLTSRYASSEG